MSGCVINKTTINAGEAVRVDLLKRRRRKEERKDEGERSDVTPERLSQSELCAS